MSTELGNRFGYMCPVCGSDRDISVQLVRATVLLLPDNELVATLAFSQEDPASCFKCGWFGAVADLGRRYSHLNVTRN